MEKKAQIWCLNFLRMLLQTAEDLMAEVMEQLTPELVDRWSQHDYSVEAVLKGITSELSDIYLLLIITIRTKELKLKVEFPEHFVSQK